MTHPAEYLFELTEAYYSLTLKLETFNEYALQDPLSSMSINKLGSIRDTIENLDRLFEILAEFYVFSESQGYLYKVRELHNEVKRLYLAFDPSDPGDQTIEALQTADETLSLVRLAKSGVLDNLEEDSDGADKSLSKDNISSGISSVRAPKIQASTFASLLVQLEQYKSVEEYRPSDNAQPISLSKTQLDIVRHSLAIAAKVAELPNWSVGIQTQIKGITAVLEELAPLIHPVSKPLSKAWDSAIHGLREALRALMTNNSSS